MRTAVTLAAVCIVLGLALAARPPGRIAYAGASLYLFGGVLMFWAGLIWVIS